MGGKIGKDEGARKGEEEDAGWQPCKEPKSENNQPHLQAEAYFL